MFIRSSPTTCPSNASAVKTNHVAYNSGPPATHETSKETKKKPIDVIHDLAKPYVESLYSGNIKLWRAFYATVTWPPSTRFPISEDHNSERTSGLVLPPRGTTLFFQCWARFCIVRSVCFVCVRRLSPRAADKTKKEMVLQVRP